MIHKILAIIIASLSTIHTYPGTSMNNSTNNLNVENNVAPEIVKINQSYFIDGVEIHDSSELINNNKNAVSISTTSVSNWNMVSKNLETGTLDFFYFDENHYLYRQFAYDDEQNTSQISTASALSNNSTLNDYSKIECAEVQTLKNENGSVMFFNDGYDPEIIESNNEYNLMTFGVIGDDDRIVVNDTTTGMYKYAGNVIAKYNVQNVKTGEIDTLYYGSTGFMEGPDLLLTAGHSVYGDVTSGDERYEDNLFNPRFPDEIYYYPARNGNVKPYGGITVERVYLEKSYYQETTKDWACCKLSTKIGNTTGWFGKISNFYRENYTINTFGYPSSGEFKMYESSGKMTFFEDNGYYYRTDLDADGGQSGSPYIINYNSHNYVCGIHTYCAIYTSSGETAYTGGIRIDGFMFAFMNSFVTSESLYDIKVEDYGFADAYPTDDYTKNNFTIHNLSNGLTFRTRRYRTGYIQEEYIVMSSIRDNIPEPKAYIEYSFKRPIEKMDVDLSMWRASSNEFITESNGKACLQIPGKDGWEDKFDLLSSETALPTDRTQPKTYTIEFETPVYSFRFYSEYYGTDYVSGSNRGRICIGDMRLQFQRSDYMPLNWSELEYEPSKWNDSNVEEYNCYAYALNTKNYGFMQPGQSEGHNYRNTDDYFSKDVLLSMIGLDASNYNFDFKPIGKNEQCDSGYYKVALVVAPGRDYHWYRQNPDGTWSHKSGKTPVTNLDSSNNLIYDPEICNRNYFWINYTEFYGFYQVNIQTMM